MTAIPDDVRERIDAEFAGETYYEALRLLETWGFEVPVLRAVTLLARGDLEDLRRYARAAERDPEQVVSWAEHGDAGTERPRRRRSMHEPLPAPGRD